MVTVNITLDLTADDIKELDPNKVSEFVNFLEKSLSENIHILVP